MDDIGMCSCLIEWRLGNFWEAGRNAVYVRKQKVSFKGHRERLVNSYEKAINGTVLSKLTFEEVFNLSIRRFKIVSKYSIETSIRFHLSKLRNLGGFLTFLTEMTSYKIFFLEKEGWKFEKEIKSWKAFQSFNDRHDIREYACSRVKLSISPKKDSTDLFGYVTKIHVKSLNTEKVGAISASDHPNADKPTLSHRNT